VSPAVIALGRAKKENYGIKFTCLSVFFCVVPLKKAKNKSYKHKDKVFELVIRLLA
jgi:hypothetical protein